MRRPGHSPASEAKAVAAAAAAAPSGPGFPIPVPNPYIVDPPAFPEHAQTGVTGMPAHSCMGLNSCRGTDRFGLVGPPGRGPNACAGQGYCATSNNHTCHVQNDCRNQGGCGLYGTAEEMNRPGYNDCRSQGSCATPINAERFSTNGQNQGKSVWARARELFETEVWPALRDELQGKRESGAIPADQPLPETLGKPPAPFTESGPSYLWISSVNADRGAFQACGSSGMSGAGGCS
jgi:hypothetical protein